MLIYRRLPNQKIGNLSSDASMRFIPLPWKHYYINNQHFDKRVHILRVAVVQVF